MTPMKCFRVSDTEIFAEDSTGHLNLICTCPSEAALTFVLHSLTHFHSETPTLTMNEHPRALAPFTDKQCKALENYQRSATHEYTCKNGHGFLIVERRGLVCSWSDCYYVQTWAHAEHTGVK
jgi:hypothetical protein